MNMNVMYEHDHETEDWKAAAACADQLDVDFFPINDDRGETTRALAVCAGCPVQDECLAFAIETNQADGIWGGTTPGERSRMRRVWLRDLRAAS
jgi:WhiB family transcriptional regulator, redox-sensing transcriptional regulator